MANQDFWMGRKWGRGGGAGAIKVRNNELLMLKRHHVLQINWLDTRGGTCTYLISAIGREYIRQGLRDVSYVLVWDR